MLWAKDFLHPDNRALVLDDDEPERLLEKMAHYKPIRAAKWIGREER